MVKSDGTPDMLFGEDGKAMTDLGSTIEGLGAVLIQPDGKILAAGISNTDFVLVRYLR